MNRSLKAKVDREKARRYPRRPSPITRPDPPTYALADPLMRDSATGRYMVPRNINPFEYHRKDDSREDRACITDRWKFPLTTLRCCPLCSQPLVTYETYHEAIDGKPYVPPSVPKSEQNEDDSPPPTKVVIAYFDSPWKTISARAGTTLPVGRMKDAMDYYSKQRASRKWAGGRLYLSQGVLKLEFWR